MISHLEQAFENFEYNAEQRGIERGIEKTAIRICVRMPLWITLLNLQAYPKFVLRN